MPQMKSSSTAASPVIRPTLREMSPATKASVSATAMPGDFLPPPPLASIIAVASARNWPTPRMVIASETLVTLPAPIDAELTRRSSFCVRAKSRITRSESCWIDAVSPAAEIWLMLVRLADNAGKSLLCAMRRSRNSTVLCTTVSRTSTLSVAPVDTRMRSSARFISVAFW